MGDVMIKQSFRVVHVYFLALITVLAMVVPDIAPANNHNWALQQQRMLQNQRAAQQARDAQRAAQQARIRQQQMREQREIQRQQAVQQRALREQQRAQRELQRAQRAQLQAQRAQQEAARAQRQQVATQPAAQRPSTLNAAQLQTIRNQLRAANDNKRLLEIRRLAQQALERRRAEEAKRQAAMTPVLSSTLRAAAGGAGKPPRNPQTVGGSSNGGANQPPSRALNAANDNKNIAAVRAGQAQAAAMLSRANSSLAAQARLAQGKDANQLLKSVLSQNGLSQDYVRNVQRAFSGEITALRLKTPMVLYRTHGGKSGPIGQWATRIPFNDPVLARQRLALPNSATANKTTKFIVPAGTILFVGKVAPQPSFGNYAKGGAEQIYLPNRNNLIKLD